MELFRAVLYTSLPMYLILAYYNFVSIENPSLEVEKHKKFFENRDVTGRIYLSEEGINGQMSGIESDAKAYIEWFLSDPKFANTKFKIHRHHENVFPRMTVKVRKQLVALDESVEGEQTGTYLTPAEWRKTLESDEDFFLIDVRNQYEWKIGHFEKSTLPTLEQFRDFPRYAEELKNKLPPDKKILMCCTGGIRCELYSKLLKKKGFKNVYQLEGGIIDYGLKEGSSAWKGKLFVFDDRLAIPIDGQTNEAISHCHHCNQKADTYYNCANMDCNELFLGCPSCHESYLGCCSPACKDHPRRRPFKRGNKPFRRKHLLDSSERQ